MKEYLLHDIMELNVTEDSGWRSIWEILRPMFKSGFTSTIEAYDRDK
jgi:hypothetical protein